MEIIVNKEETLFIIQMSHKLNQPELADLIKFKEQFQTIFDGSICALPLPQNAPAEMPRIILSSINGQNRIEFAINQMVFTYNRSVIDKLDDILEIIRSLLSKYQNHLYINKMGVVSRTLFSVNDPCSIVKQKFGIPDSFDKNINKLGDIWFCYRDIQEKGDLYFNHWIKVQTGIKPPLLDNNKTIQNNEYIPDSIIIDQDINNKVMGLTKLSLEVIENFLKIAYEFNDKYIESFLGTSNV
jgi:hypothetical protein